MSEAGSPASGRQVSRSASPDPAPASPDKNTSRSPVRGSPEIEVKIQAALTAALGETFPLWQMCPTVVILAMFTIATTLFVTSYPGVHLESKRFLVQNGQRSKSVSRSPEASPAPMKSRSASPPASPDRSRSRSGGKGKRSRSRSK